MYITVSDIQIPYEKFLIRAGYKKSGAPPDKNARVLIEETLLTAKRLLKPKSAVVFSEIKLNGGSVLFNGGFKINSRFVANLFEDCFKAYAIAVTIGPEIEKKRNELMAQKEILRAFFLDAAGSVAVEEAAETANARIKSFEEKENNFVTKRFSPGYGDWELKTQKDFLKWLGAGQIGISLTEAFLMRPEKSVSAIIGVKKNK